MPAVLCGIGFRTIRVQPDETGFATLFGSSAVIREGSDGATAFCEIR